ncbi:MAG: amidase family protein [Acidimicrobiales bacterium]
MDELAALDATAQAELVRTDQASPKELVDAAIERIERLNPTLNAVIHERFDKARAEAAAEVPDGPFRGVPFVVKDFGCHTAGDPFHEGMGFLKRLGWTEDHDTHLAQRFREAGLIVVGRTNTPECGIVPTTEPEAYGPTRNPWNTDHSTGGSSGGSAAAVASGMVAAGHANDGGGSIRIPASECGLVGLKPSRGRVSLGPEFGDLMGGLVIEFAVTRTVRDSARLLDAVAGPAPGEPFLLAPPTRPYAQEVGAEVGPLRIGLMTTVPAATMPLHSDCVTAVERTGVLLATLGHEVEVSHPAALDEPDYTTHFASNWAAGNAWMLDYWSRRTGQVIGQDDVEPLTWALSELGRSSSAADWLSSREWLQANCRRLAGWWRDQPDIGGYDLLVTPTIAEPPPPLGEFASPSDNPFQGLFRAAALVPFTPPFNVSGQPAISLPLHQNEAGLPIGVQFVASMGAEDLLLRIAAQLEVAAPWQGRRPAVHS